MNGPGHVTKMAGTAINRLYTCIMTIIVEQVYWYIFQVSVYRTIGSLVLNYFSRIRTLVPIAT